MGAEPEDAWKDTARLHRPEEQVRGQLGSGYALPVPGPTFTPSAIRAGLHCAPGTSGSPKRPGYWLITFLFLINQIIFYSFFKINYWLCWPLVAACRLCSWLPDWGWDPSSCAESEGLTRGDIPAPAPRARA